MEKIFSSEKKTKNTPEWKFTQGKRLGIIEEKMSSWNGYFSTKKLELDAWIKLNDFALMSE